MSIILHDDDSIHPMLRPKRPAIATRPVNRVADACSLSLERGDRGIPIKGNGRCGKTWAVELLANDLIWRPYPMAFFQMDFGSPEKSTEAYFFGSFIVAAKLKAVRHASGIDNIARTCGHLLELSKAHKEQIIAVAINEANRFTSRDHDHLVTLDNALERQGKRLFAILIYQSDAEQSTKQQIDARPPPQQKGRFFSTAHEFTGLLWGLPDSSDCDVWLALEEYDTTIIHPPVTGVPCTQFFAPVAYASNWRLTRQLPLYRKELEDLRVQHGLPPVAPWPMQTFERFVYFLLVRIAGDDPNFREFTAEQVRAALGWCDYIDLELSRYPEILK